MSDEPRLLYLEPDDEIPSVVRRIREADAGRVVLVVSGRSRATTSAVGLRLLASFASEAGRELAIVADPATRALAAEAGIPAYATVPDVTSGVIAAVEAAAPRAPITVVRGPSPSPSVRAGSGDETMAVKLPPAEPRGGGAPPRTPRAPRASRGRGGPGGWLLALVSVLLLALVSGAVLLPSAEIRIAAATTEIGPLEYPVAVPIAERESGELTSVQRATPTGERIEQVPATGTVTFLNWNTVAVAVPQGTRVSVGGGTAFVTDQLLIVPRGRITGQTLIPSEATVGVTAVEGGPGGNVEATTINTIEDNSVRSFLAGFPENPNRLVSNEEATSGGEDVPHTVVTQSDVDALVERVEADLAAQLASQLRADDGFYAAPPEGEEPIIEIPDDLVGTEDLETIELTGTLVFDRAFGMRSAATEAALAAFGDDEDAVPIGTSLLPDATTVELGPATEVSGELRLVVSVRATAVAGVDVEEIRRRVAGMTAPEAVAELAGIGDATVTFWPAWVDRVPGLAFRVTVVPVEPSASETPGG